MSRSQKIFGGERLLIVHTNRADGVWLELEEDEEPTFLLLENNHLVHLRNILTREIDRRQIRNFRKSSPLLYPYDSTTRKTDGSKEVPSEGRAEIHSTDDRDSS